MRLPPTRTRPRHAGAAPAFLPAFVLGALTIVAAVVVIGLTGSGVADVVAVILVIAVAGLFTALIVRRMGDDEDADGGSPQGTEGKRR